MSKIINRIYNDYFMKNRFEEYENLIKELLENNYEFIKICDYEKLNDKKKHVIIRHDIDTDIKIAKKMFEIEKKYNINTTYYFRKYTFDKNFIKEINDYGSEVGYHYEEIATYCKNNKINTREEVLNKIEEIRKIFCKNINNFEEEFNLKLNSIAAHGDFINRKFKLSNQILFDKKTRKKFPNIVEAYDDVIEKKLDSRISDCMYPVFWKPNNPIESINDNKKNILLLVHTRWWSKNPLERIKLDFCELIKR